MAGDAIGELDTKAADAVKSVSVWHSLWLFWRDLSSKTNQSAIVNENIWA